MDYDFTKLQNGSDIRGIALAGVEGENPNLGPVEAARIAEGFLVWLTHRTGKPCDALKVAMGSDPRLSRPILAENIVRAVTAHGTEVLNAGIASTPAMFMSTVFPETACDGAVMITASHLPFNRNGFKFFTRDGGLDKKDIREIIEYAQSDSKLDELPFSADFAPEKKSDLMKLYSAHLRNLIISATGDERPLEGMKICVDAGNGSGGFYAEDVLKPLGADISASQFLQPDGTFPNHAPNPENREAMRSISEKVVSSGCDFGIIFDTDVDRSAAVDRYGREISRNGIVAMAASLVCEEHPGTTIVTDSITSDQLTEYLEETLGMKHLRFKRGYKNVINKAIELNENGEECWLAIETSGHAALKENYFLDDGAYLATKIVIKAAKLRKEGKTLDSLLENLKEPLEASEVRFPITVPDFSQYADMVLENFKNWANREGITVVTPNYEGVRLSFGSGWCLLRKSLHDPIMPLNVESDIAGGTDDILNRVYSFLSDFDGIDTGR